MANVRVRHSYSGSVHEAQSCWCDVRRWPEWVDGLGRVVRVDDGWPAVGSSVVWESGPAGRGRVSERVTDYIPLERLEVFIEDSLMEADQSVSFEPASPGVEVELTLSYRMRRRSPLTPLIEWLFVRRPMTLSLTKTLGRFGTALAASRASDLG